MELSTTITSLVKEEDRGDLKVLGQGLLAMLNKEQKGWIPMPRKKKLEEAAADNASKQAEVKNDAGKQQTKSSNGQSDEKALPPATKDSDRNRQQAKSRPDLSQSRTVSQHKLPARPESTSKASTTAERWPGSG